MKNIKFRKIAPLFLIAVTFLALSSCSKKESVQVAPTFSKITPLKQLDTSISTGNMGDWIAIQGEALETAQSITFNDATVDMKDVYYENNILYLQIPKVMPNEVTNKVKVTTAAGAFDFNFTVNIPNLKLTTMFNEYTAPGDTLKIYGDFFKLYEVDPTNTVVSFNGIEQPVIQVGENFITVKVPVNVAPNIKLTVKNSKFNATVVCPGYYQDRQFLITNFDDVAYTGYDGSQFVGLWTNPKPISGKYSLVKIGTEGSGWFYMMGTGVNYTSDMKDQPDKYEIRFELNMVTPIMKTKLYIYNYWNYTPAEIIAADLVVQNLGVWQTIRIPLEFNTPHS